MIFYYVFLINFSHHSTRKSCMVIRHSRLPAGNALWFCQNFYFLFFRRQGFRMITFDRQAGPLQNFNRSHVMVIGRSVSFSDPRVGAWGAPNTPISPPFEKNILVGKKNLEIFRLPPPPPKKVFCVLRPQEHFLAKKKFQLKIPPPPPPPHELHIMCLCVKAHH